MWKTKREEHVLDKTLKEIRDTAREIRDAVKEAGKETATRLDAIIANQNRRHRAESSGI